MRSETCIEFAPLAGLPGWQFAETVEVVVEPGDPLESVWLARLEGEHPVFGFRRRFELPCYVSRDVERGGLRVRFRFPAAGMYELQRLVAGVRERYLVLIDEWRRIFPLPWEVAELVAPVLESLRTKDGALPKSTKEKSVLTLRISSAIACEYAGRMPDEIPTRCHEPGRYEFTAAELRAIRDDAAWYADADSVDVAPGLRRAYRALAAKAVAALTDRG